MRFSRRRFLMMGTGGAIIAGLGYVLFRHLREGREEKEFKLKNLSSREARIIKMLTEDLFDIEKTGLPLNMNNMLEKIDDYVGSLPPLYRRLYLGLFHFFEHGTLFTRYFPAPYTSLPQNSRKNYLSSFLHSRLTIKRQLLSACKMALGLVVFSFPEVNEFIGFKKECL